MFLPSSPWTPQSRLICKYPTSDELTSTGSDLDDHMGGHIKDNQ